MALRIRIRIKGSLWIRFQIQKYCIVQRSSDKFVDDISSFILNVYYKKQSASSSSNYYHSLEYKQSIVPCGPTDADLFPIVKISKSLQNPSSS